MKRFSKFFNITLRLRWQVLAELFSFLQLITFYIEKSHSTFWWVTATVEVLTWPGCPWVRTGWRAAPPAPVSSSWGRRSLDDIGTDPRSSGTSGLPPCSGATLTHTRTKVKKYTLTTWIWSSWNSRIYVFRVRQSTLWQCWRGLIQRWRGWSGQLSHLHLSLRSPQTQKQRQFKPKITKVHQKILNNEIFF